MILVLKRIICLIAVLTVIFSLSVSAVDDLLVYGEDDIEGICNALDMNDCDIADYCKQNNVTYLAVNPDNTKLVKRVEIADDFSKRIVDLSVLSDENIQTLSYELSHFSDAKGRVVSLDGFRLLKYELKTEDNEYYLTTYITVKNSKRITLSFYTNVGTERDYIDSIVKEQFKADVNYKPFVIVGVVIFGCAAAVAAVLIIKELRKKED